MLAVIQTVLHVRAVVSQKFVQVAVTTSIFQEQLVLKVAVVNVCIVQVLIYALNANVDIRFFKMLILLLLLLSVFNASRAASFVFKINHHIARRVEKDLILRAPSV